MAMAFHARLGVDSHIGKLKEDVVIKILEHVDFEEYTETSDVRKLWQLLIQHGTDPNQRTPDSNYWAFATQLRRCKCNRLRSFLLSKFVLLSQLGSRNIQADLFLSQFQMRMYLADTLQNPHLT